MTWVFPLLFSSPFSAKSKDFCFLGKWTKNRFWPRHFFSKIGLCLVTDAKNQRNRMKGSIRTLATNDRQFQLHRTHCLLNVAGQKVMKIWCSVEWAQGSILNLINKAPVPSWPSIMSWIQFYHFPVNEYWNWNIHPSFLHRGVGPISWESSGLKA